MQNVSIVNTTESLYSELIERIANNIHAKVKKHEGKHKRSALKVFWGWTSEVHLEPEQEGVKYNFLIKIYIGDTKEQGVAFFRNHPVAIDFPDELIGYQLTNQYFLKFAHFNATIFSFYPAVSEYKITHTREFFKKYSGRHQKDNWQVIENVLTEISPGWKTKCEYEKKITGSKRGYFDLSTGILLTLHVPYNPEQLLDAGGIPVSLTDELTGCILAMKNLIEKSSG